MTTTLTMQEVAEGLTSLYNKKNGLRYRMSFLLIMCEALSRQILLTLVCGG